MREDLASLNLIAMATHRWKKSTIRVRKNKGLEMMVSEIIRLALMGIAQEI
jgi:hypothetical protein